MKKKITVDDDMDYLSPEGMDYYLHAEGREEERPMLDNDIWDLLEELPLLKIIEKRRDTKC